MKKLLIALFLMPWVGFGQEYKLLSKIEMEVAGTSTLHDWEMVSETGAGKANFSIVDGALTDVKNLSFEVKTRTLKSGKNAMDKICYESMKEEMYKTIRFDLNEVITLQKTGANYTLKTRGKLSIAGTTKVINLNVKAVRSGTSLQFSGEYKMKMTDYNIEPPTAVFGTIKTGDEIIVTFKVKYVSSPSS